MFAAFVAFSASFLALTIILLHRMWEMNKGRTFIGRAILPKSDSLIKEQFDAHKERIVGGGKRGVKALSSITRESLKHFFLMGVHYLHDKLTEIILKMRSRGQKHASGVSFFLKRMEGERELPKIEDVKVNKKPRRLKVQEEKPAEMGKGDDNISN
jgi:hypothetical protein